MNEYSDVPEILIWGRREVKALKKMVASWLGGPDEVTWLEKCT